MGILNLFKKKDLIKSTFKIDGMMCGMCEAHVCDAIRRGMKVNKVEASHSKGELYIYSDKEVSVDEVEKVLEPTGYRVIK